MKSGIYQIINNINQHCYIGSAVDFNKRWSLHLHLLRKGTHRSNYLQSAFRLYGEDSFHFDIIEYCEKNKLIEREQFYIDLYKTKNIKLYNICLTAGSNFGRKFSDEHKKRISESEKGKRVSKETRVKLSQANKGKSRRKWTSEEKEKQGQIMIGKNVGKICSEKTKRKISKSMRGIRKGIKLSVEHRNKLSDAHKGRLVSDETRKRLSEALKGRKFSEEHKLNLSKAKQKFLKNKTNDANN